MLRGRDLLSGGILHSKNVRLQTDIHIHIHVVKEFGSTKSHCVSKHNETLTLACEKALARRV